MYLGICIELSFIATQMNESNITNTSFFSIGYSMVQTRIGKIRKAVTSKSSSYKYSVEEQGWMQCCSKIGDILSHFTK